jgi:Acetyltransferase (GNAT) domain
MDWKFYPLADFIWHHSKWDKLNAESTQTPLLCADFVLPLLDQFSGGKDCFAICGNVDNPTAMTIIGKRNAIAWGTLQPPPAPLGLWLQRKGAPTSLLMAQLLKSLPFPALLFGITQQDPDLLPRPENQGKLTTFNGIETACIILEDGFEDYWENLRQNLKQQRDRLAREGTHITLKVFTSATDMQQAVIDYGKLESAGGKNQVDTAIDIDNNQGQFYRDMLVNFCRHDNALVFQCYYNDQLVATDLCIKDTQSLIILKTACDETITTSSPAMLMRQDALEYISNNNLVKKIEFYSKLMDCHTQWSDEIRHIYQVNYHRFFGK